MTMTRKRAAAIKALNDGDRTLSDALDMLEQAMELIEDAVEQETEFETEWNKDARDLIATWEGKEK